MIGQVEFISGSVESKGAGCVIDLGNNTLVLMRVHLMLDVNVAIAWRKS